jgi:hypothetical protein
MRAVGLRRKNRRIAGLTQIAMTGGFRLRPVALPAEHGGWSLLFEPVVLGLLVAPSLAGLFLALAATATFLARHPFKLAIGDWRRQRHSKRTTFAEIFTVIYASAAALAFAAAIGTTTSSFWLLILIAAPFAASQLLLDSLGRSRALAAELAGSIATGAIAGLIALSGGWPRATALALWAIMTARAVPTILYLRARLRLLRRRPASKTVVIVAHLIGLLMVIGLACGGLAPWLAIAAVTLFLLRAVIGFTAEAEKVSAKKLGLREIIFGAISVFAVAIGYRAGW